MAPAWRGCPGKRARERADIRRALQVRALSKLSPLADWPHGYAAWVVSTWMQVEHEVQTMAAAEREVTR